MARARMIRPGFWDDEKLARVSRESRLTFVGLWCVSDDYGVVKGHPAWLRGQIYPYDDDITSDMMRGWLDDLERIGAIVHFEHNGESYYYIRHFAKHQRVEHPSKRVYPEPPADIDSRGTRESFAKDSRETLEALARDSRETRESLARDSRETRESFAKDSREFRAQLELEVNKKLSLENMRERTSVLSLVPTDAGWDDGEIEKRATQKRAQQKKHPPCPYQEIIDAYHDALPMAPRIHAIDETTRRHLQTRWREDPERQSIDWWREFFAYCSQSRFLTGQKTDFVADLFWLARPSNMAKVIAGRYHHERPGADLPDAARQTRQAAAKVAERIQRGEL